MEKILLQNMMFYGFHGVFEYEREQGQRFFMDVELSGDLSRATVSDNLEDTIDYTILYNHIKNIVENQRFQLLEALGGHIADHILKYSVQVQRVIVRIRKPAVPIPGAIDFVQVEISKSR